MNKRWGHFDGDNLEVGILEVCILEVGILEVGNLKVGVLEVSILEVCILEFDIKTEQLCLHKLKARGWSSQTMTLLSRSQLRPAYLDRRSRYLIKVTRLGDVPSTGWFIYFGQFLKILEVARFFGGFFPIVRIMCKYCQKMGWATFWSIF
jgi:hypothetical protein